MLQRCLFIACLLFAFGAKAQLTQEHCSWDYALEKADAEIHLLAKNEGAQSYWSGASFVNFFFTEVIKPFHFTASDKRTVAGFVSINLDTCRVVGSNYGDTSKKPVTQ